MAGLSQTFHLSFVIPVYNEEKTVDDLACRIHAVVKNGDFGKFEILFIDDGSNDGTWRAIERSRAILGSHVSGFRLRRNFGKAVALAVGFEIAQGQIIFTLDGDLQDDPNEIPNFIKKIHEGYDLVTGWKKKRNDPLSKTLPSKIFNIITNLISGPNLHDINCGFKAYRHEVAKSLKLYGELHRFIPILAHDLGFRVTEIPVAHHSRQYGRSKYGSIRFFKGFIDLLTIIATTRFLARPAHLFSGIGLILGLAGMGILSYLTFLWFLGQSIGTRPLLFLGILCLLIASNMIFFGLLAEILNRRLAPSSSFILIREKLKTAKENPAE